MNEPAEVKTEVYMDHNATTYTREEVFAAMKPYFTDKFGNASSPYPVGQESREAIEKAREKAASLIGAAPREIVFTSGGTESNNLAIRGVLKATGKRLEDCRIITSAIEHPAVINTCDSLEGDGVRVDRISCGPQGMIDPGEVEKSLEPGADLISIMLANNETGVIQPIEDVAGLAAASNTAFHVDAVQGVGKIEVDVGRLGIDLLSISGHKFYGPKGIGALYIRTGTPVKAVYTGADHEFSMRPGTENVPAIVGMGKACEMTGINLGEEMAGIGRLRDRMEEELTERIENIKIVGKGSPRVPNTSSVAISSVEGEAVVLNLAALGFDVSSGSACSTGKGGISHVIRAVGLDSRYANGVIRVSLGIRNTEDDIDRFVETLTSVVKRLRDMSPVN